MRKHRSTFKKTVFRIHFWMLGGQKPNSWTYNFVEVSGYNHESSQPCGFCMDFLNHREGDTVFYQVFFRSPLQCTVTELYIETVRGCVSLKKKSQGKAVEVTVNNKEEGKLLRLCLDFVQEFNLCIRSYFFSSKHTRFQWGSGSMYSVLYICRRRYPAWNSTVLMKWCSFGGEVTRGRGCCVEMTTFFPSN